MKLNPYAGLWQIAMEKRGEKESWVWASSMGVGWLRGGVESGGREDWRGDGWVVLWAATGEWWLRGRVELGRREGWLEKRDGNFFKKFL
ncbi:unnamed protein product [Prunus armeniaca]